MLEREKALAQAVLGLAGRMICDSKTDYRQQHPDHATIFNANVCTPEGKIWFGDLDLTLDEPLLRQLATRLGTVVFVLYERDARFRSEAKPRLDRAVAAFGGAGAVWFDERVSKWAEDGTLRWLTREEREARRRAEEN